MSSWVRQCVLAALVGGAAAGFALLVSAGLAAIPIALPVTNFALHFGEAGLFALYEITVGLPTLAAVCVVATPAFRSLGLISKCALIASLLAWLVSDALYLHGLQQSSMALPEARWGLMADWQVWLAYLLIPLALAVSWRLARGSVMRKSPSAQ